MPRKILPENGWLEAAKGLKTRKNLFEAGRNYADEFLDKSTISATAARRPTLLLLSCSAEAACLGYLSLIPLLV